MRADSRLGGEGGMDQDLQYALPEWVMQMTENERSGMYMEAITTGCLLTQNSICILDSPFTTHLVHSWHRRKIKSPPPPRPRNLPAP